MSTPKEDVGSLLVNIGWLIVAWAFLSFIAVMIVGFIPGSKMFWTSSLFWSMVSGLVAAPAYFVMFVLPDVSKRRKQMARNGTEQEEVEEFDSDEFEIPDDTGEVEELEMGNDVWDRELA